MDQIPEPTQLQILNSIADNTTILQTLHTQQINILTKLFRLQTTAPFEAVKIRNTLMQVLLLERENYAEYLGLSKFSSLPDTLRQKLTRFFQQVWSKFNEQANKKNNPQILVNTSAPTYTPFVLNNNPNIKDPSLDCYSYFRSFPYQVNYDTKLSFQQYPYYFNFSSFAPKPMSFPSFPQQSINPLQQPYYQKQSQSQQIQPEKQSAPQLQFKRQQQSVSNILKLPKQQGLNIINLSFLHCACEGLRTQQDTQYFQCPYCHKFYHFACLKVAKREATNCPLCVLSVQHIFTESNQRIIKSGWLQMQVEQICYFKIKFSQEQMAIFNMFLKKQSSENGNNGSIQFRLIRIADNRRNLQQQSTIKSSFTISLSELKRIQTRQWIQLRMKNIKQISLLFYAIMFNKYKEITELQEVYQNLERSQQLIPIWENRQKQQGRQIVIDLRHPTAADNKLIQFPVRGQLCNHLECEDLLQLYRTFKQPLQHNNRLLCSHCNIIYTPQSKFYRDDTIYNLLRHKQSKRQRIALVNGKIAWMENQPQAMQQEQPVIEQSQQVDAPQQPADIGYSHGSSQSSSSSDSES